ncbi:hypothetical protein NAF17_00855 [Mucilaginibacter sp. RB4R14]|uniref:hypothetical protein n=1 Tax=Mucilaginibacter aurantiaciroseus TaxID=2949308 RepID=UPI002091C1EC|nr:hypothetical protein [Mucilaginibacter aurantiaciroseus]MCO5934073.1 hypothetical protein [Mucilaginibacter aurantiaciroseus]
MQIQVDIGFNDLVEIVKNLPKDKLLQLKRELEEKPVKVEKDQFRELLINGPTFSDEQIATMEEAQKAINQWRTK